MYCIVWFVTDAAYSTRYAIDNKLKIKMAIKPNPNQTSTLLVRKCIQTLLALINK